jgi:hypothetical protein
MAIDLSPSKIVLDALLIGIDYNPAIEGRDFLHLYVEVFTPVEDIG